MKLWGWTVALGLLATAVPGWTGGEWNPDPKLAATEKLRQRLDLYLRFLNANDQERPALKAQDSAGGIVSMERNAFLRSRLQLVAVLSPREREANLRGQPYTSAPYAKLSRQMQTWVNEALGVGRLPAPERDVTRYMVSRRPSDGGMHLMINVVNGQGKVGSGGSVLPGVRLR